MRFEKVIQKFCDQIGIEKKALISILQPEKSQVEPMLPSALESMTINDGRPQT